jgi:hypothetical protein
MLSITKIAIFASKLSRRKKIDLLREMLIKSNSILDIGAGRGDFFYEELSKMDLTNKSVLAVDLRESYLRSINERFPFVETKATDVRQFNVNKTKYDLIVCNAVLEHIPEIVYDISKFIDYSGKCYFVSVPYRYSIFESHYRLPFGGFFSPKIRDFIVSKLLRMKIHNDPIRLITVKEFKQMFPNAQIKKLYAIGCLFCSLVAIKNSLY